MLLDKNNSCAAAAAKPLQLCPTLCDPIDGSPPGSPTPGILQARTLEWVAISFSNVWKWKWSLSVVSNPQRPYGLQPSRLLRPWDFPGKSTGVGCHCLFLYTEYIMQNARIEETQAGIKIARRNISNFRYADDTTLMAESEEELKSLLMKVKEESEKAGLKFNIQKTKIIASGPITS